MKYKCISLIAAAFIITSLCACGNDTNKAESSANLGSSLESIVSIVEDSEIGGSQKEDTLSDDEKEYSKTYGWSIDKVMADDAKIAEYDNFSKAFVDKFHEPFSAEITKIRELDNKERRNAYYMTCKFSANKNEKDDYLTYNISDIVFQYYNFKDNDYAEILNNYFKGITITSREYLPSGFSDIQHDITVSKDGTVLKDGMSYTSLDSSLYKYIEPNYRSLDNDTTDVFIYATGYINEVITLDKMGYAYDSENRKGYGYIVAYPDNDTSGDTDNKKSYVACSENKLIYEMSPYYVIEKLSDKHYAASTYIPYENVEDDTKFGVITENFIAKFD